MTKSTSLPPSDRVILVTGATNGIGMQTALDLARTGARVLVHGRDEARGNTVVERIRRDTGNAHVELVVADLAAQRQVRALAAEIERRCDRLHVLVNNAGVYMRDRQLTEDGLETTFAVNHLAPFLLTLLLQDLLERSAPARVVTVSSQTHQSARVDFENLQGEKRYEGYAAYALSKLGNVLFTYELAERLAGTGVTANCLHPGVIATNLLHAGWGGGGGDLREGAETPVHLATAPEIEGVTGKYFVRRRATASSSRSQDRELRRKFWDVSEQLAGLA